MERVDVSCRDTLVSVYDAEREGRVPESNRHRIGHILHPNLRISLEKVGAGTYIVIVPPNNMYVRSYGPQVLVRLAIAYVPRTDYLLNLSGNLYPITNIFVSARRRHTKYDKLTSSFLNFAGKS